jgi:hypothetical protein
MPILKYIYRSIFSPMDVMDREYSQGKLATSFFIVILTAAAMSFLTDISYYLTFRDKYDLSFNLKTTFIVFCAGILTWLVACAALWALSAFFRKAVGIRQILSTWGFSYIPNLICILAYNALLVKPFLLPNNGMSTFLLKTFFIMLLIWKALYYLIEMKCVIKTTVFELLIMTIVNGIVFMVLMALGGLAGLQIPML